MDYIQIIQVRVDRLMHGNPGQHRHMGEGVAELKIDIEMALELARHL